MDSEDHMGCEIMYFSSLSRRANHSLTEVVEASIMAGSHHLPAFTFIDGGLWDSPLCDPETAGAGVGFIPFGPWAEGSVHSFRLACALSRCNKVPPRKRQICCRQRED